MEKNNLKKSYGYTTESGESGSTDPLYGVSCAKQIDKCVCPHVIFCPENAKINTSVHPSHNINGEIPNELT